MVIVELESKTGKFESGRDQIALEHPNPNLLMADVLNHFSCAYTVVVLSKLCIKDGLKLTSSKIWAFNYSFSVADEEMIIS